jgi:hypothetical protein
VNWEFTDIADYGQQMAIFGKYIGVLATEYHLLTQSGRTNEAAVTNQELLNALFAYKRLDLCENSLDPLLPDEYNGFFIRHDVPEAPFGEPNPFITQSELNTDMGLLIDGDQLLDDGEIEQVTWVDFTMTPANEWISQDEAVFLLEELALAYKFGSSEVRLEALNHAWVIMNRMYGFVSPGLHHTDWYIYNHYGIPIPWPEGGNCRTLSFGYELMARKFFGFQSFIHFPGTEAIWWELCLLGNSGGDAQMVAATAAIGRGWEGQTQSGIYKNTDQFGWDYYYLWLYKALWDDNENYYGVDRIGDRLDEGPCEGPWWEKDVRHALHGWASPDRWRHDIGKQCGYNPCMVGIYSGMDYMILLNLYYICNGEDLVEYRNRINATQGQIWPYGTNGSVSNPKYIEVFRKIESTDVLINSPIAADVNYRAGESIVLKPGFKVMKGAHFSAVTDPLDYCSTAPVNHGSCAVKSSSIIENDNYYGDDEESVSSRYRYLFDRDYLGQNKSSDQCLPTNEEVEVYPNPCHGNLNIENIEGFHNYRIITILGSTMEYGSIVGNHCSINLENYSPGLYYIVLSGKTHSEVLKFSFIKQ